MIRSTWSISLSGAAHAGTLSVVWLTARTILFFPRFEPPLMFSPPSLSYQCDLDLVSLPNCGFFIPESRKYLLEQNITRHPRDSTHE
jgi:hypothetical protein